MASCARRLRFQRLGYRRRILQERRRSAAAVDAIIGRQREIAAVGSALARLRQGAGGVLWIEGDVGAGKSAVLDILSVQASAIGRLVLHGGGDDLTAAFPLRMMTDCLGIPRHSPNSDAAAIWGLIYGVVSAGESACRIVGASARMLDLTRRLCADRAG